VRKQKDLLRRTHYRNMKPVARPAQVGPPFCDDKLTSCRCNDDNDNDDIIIIVFLVVCPPRTIWSDWTCWSSRWQTVPTHPQRQSLFCLVFLSLKSVNRYNYYRKTTHLFDCKFIVWLGLLFINNVINYSASFLTTHLIYILTLNSI